MHHKTDLLNEIETSEADVRRKRRYEFQLTYFHLPLHLSPKEYPLTLKLAKQSGEEMWLAVRNKRAIDDLLDELESLPRDGSLRQSR